MGRGDLRVVGLEGRPGPREAGRVVAAPLETGTAAQQVRGYGGLELHVNARIADDQHAAVARHCLAVHPYGCYATHCPAARAWLRDPRTVMPPVTVASA